MVGFGGLALFFLRRKSCDLTLIYFGVFRVLYAVRLLTTLAIFEAVQDFQTHIDLPAQRFTTAFLDESLARPADNGQPYHSYCSS